MSIARLSVSLWLLIGTILIPNRIEAAPEDLRAELAQVLPILEQQGLAVSVLFAPVERDAGMESDRVVSALPGEPRIPASVTKLVTAVASLDLLGPRFTFHTRIVRTGPLEDGVVRGDLFVIGDGDPFLVSERLWLLANQLRLAGVRTITGRLVMDDSARPLEDRSSFGGSDRAYAALPSALAMNFNSLAFHITPGRQSGDPVLVQQDPFALAYLEIENRLRTASPGTPPDWRIELRPVKSAPTRSASGPDPKNGTGTPKVIDATYPCEIARLEGTLPAGLAPFVAYRRARAPLALAGSLLEGFLGSVGIEVGGSIATGPAPENVPQILSFDSRPLDELIGGMNRYSNNFTANQLALAVERRCGIADSATPADPLRRAGAGLSLWLRDRVGSSERSFFADGSGLSTENRITAGALVTLLQFAWNDLQIQGSFLASLPGPGQEGTLERRLNGVGAVTVRGKTGTLADAGVSTLAGYLQTPTGSPVAFAILMKSRGERWSLSGMQDLQDRWIELYARTPGAPARR